MDLRLRLLLGAAHFIYPRLHRRVQEVYGPANWWQNSEGTLLIGWEATEAANRVADGLNQIAAAREP